MKDNEKVEYNVRLDNVLKRVRRRDDLYEKFGNPNDIILDPQSSLEKRYGEAFLNYVEDYLELDKALEYDEVYGVDLETSLFIEYVINTVNTYNYSGSKEELKRVIDSYSDPGVLAEMEYEQKIIFETFGEEAMEVILFYCGYDSRSEEDIKEFTEVYKLVHEVANEDNTEVTKKDMVKFIEKAKVFHQIHNSAILGPYKIFTRAYFS